MSSLLEDLITKLRADAAVTAIVGSGALAKLHVNFAPPGEAAPYVVMRVISGVPENSLTTDVSTRLTSTRVQVDAYAKLYGAARDLGDAVDRVISALASPDLAAQKVGDRDLYDNAAKLQCVSQDFEVYR